MLCNMFVVTSFAEKSDKPTSNTAITAVKQHNGERPKATVQRMICVFTVGQDGKRRHIWVLNCLKIFNAENVGKAELVLDTTSVTNSGTAYLYEADYSAFETVCNTLLHRHIPKKKLCRSHHHQIQVNLKLM